MNLIIVSCFFDFFSNGKEYFLLCLDIFTETGQNATYGY